MENKEKHKKKSYKKRIVQRMRMLITHLSVIGLVSIIYLIAGYSVINANYSKIVNEVNHNVQEMDLLKQDMYRHQALVFQHIMSSSTSRMSSYQSQAEELKKDISNNLENLGNNLLGTEYETCYHNVYSGIVGYMKNVDIVFDFSNNMEKETAKYYLENQLEDYLLTVNTNMKLMSDLTTQDMQSAKDKMDHNAEFVRVSSSALLTILAAVSVLSQVIAYRVANEMVNVDGITGISNMDHFLEMLHKKEKKNTLKNMTVIVLNIKGFQYINQQIGTENGDRVLRSYAKLLNDRLTKNEIIARADSDGFIILMDNNHVSDLLDYVMDINIELDMGSSIRELEEPNTITVSVPCRCGYCIIDDEINGELAIERALIALKIAKNDSFADYIKFENEMSEKEKNRTTIIHEFRDALDKQEFIVFYQPKVDSRKNVLCGAEALVRWVRNDSIIPPAQFIPFLEQDGYIIDLDFYVFEHVCLSIKRWMEMGLKPVRISSNFSKLHLRDEQFGDKIIKLVEKFKIPGEYLEIELTESVGNSDVQGLAEFIEKMKLAGIHVSIDDFGTGYSSLSMMRSLKVDTVKLDKSFIDGIIEDNEDDKKLIANIIRMIKDLKKEVICEGVETLGQAEFLKESGCFQVQGYFYDRPLPVEEFEKRICRPNY